MDQRIRYTKTNEENIIVSKKNLQNITNDAIYSVKLDLKECKFYIKNVNSGRVYDGGDGITNLHVLKRKAKERLMSLGVSFEKEIRDNSSRIPGVNCSYKRNGDE